eukprot:TRINITY_DN7246_c0_g1_i1.p1 TRINITY_DN7246_c0_g1~~TRINITY_DN7246_c0_g1_i1.p1  ORF type:complete len:110 (+),score=25.17 TRINITY_DN7246_c0_g1_i1:41-370(+)
MIRRPPRSTLSSSSAASDVYKRQTIGRVVVPAVMDDELALGPDQLVIFHHFLNWKGSLRQLYTHTLMQPHNIASTTVFFLSLIHISEPTRLLSISYAVFCLKKKKKKTH